MAKTIEYMERRSAITEAVILRLGDALRLHMPAIEPYLEVIGKQWVMELDKLEAEFPTVVNVDATKQTEVCDPLKL